MMKNPAEQMPEVLRTLGFEASDVADVSVEISHWPMNSITNPYPDQEVVEIEGNFLKVYLELGELIREMTDSYDVTGHMELKDGTMLSLHHIETEVQPMWFEISVRNGKPYMHIPIG